METSAGQGARGTGKSVKGRIRKIPSESAISLWLNFFVMADELVQRLEEVLPRLPFSKSSEWKVRKNPNPFPIWKTGFGSHLFGAGNRTGFSRLAAARSAPLSGHTVA